MLYFDTSYLLKCYIIEDGSEKVRALTQAQVINSCALARAEFFAAVHRNVRESLISWEGALQAIQDFKNDESHGHLKWLDLTMAVVERTCAIYLELPKSVPLKSADALHLACARENGFRTIYTNDRRMLAASRYFQLEAVNVIK